MKVFFSLVSVIAVSLVCHGVETIQYRNRVAPGDWLLRQSSDVVAGNVIYDHEAIAISDQYQLEGDYISYTIATLVDRTENRYQSLEVVLNTKDIFTYYQVGDGRLYSLTDISAIDIFEKNGQAYFFIGAFGDSRFAHSDQRKRARFIRLYSLADNRAINISASNASDLVAMGFKQNNFREYPVSIGNMWVYVDGVQYIFKGFASIPNADRESYFSYLEPQASSDRKNSPYFGWMHSKELNELMKF